MKNNPSKQFGTFGQSNWLDNNRRDLITNGEFKEMIEEDGLRGMTSNPPSSGCLHRRDRFSGNQKLEVGLTHE